MPRTLPNGVGANGLGVNGLGNREWHLPTVSPGELSGGTTAGELAQSPFLLPSAGETAPDAEPEAMWAAAAARANGANEPLLTAEQFLADTPEAAEPPAASTEFDAFHGIGAALSPLYSSLPAEPLASGLGGLPAVIALHQALLSATPLHATLAVLLGPAGRHSLPVHGVDIPVATYLRHLGQLFREAADHQESRLGAHGEPALYEAEAARAPRPQAAQAVTAPPHAVAGWPLGVDLYAGQQMDAAAFANLRRQGKLFAIVKSSQGTLADARFAQYYDMAKAAGLLRGSYHFFANKWDGVPQAWLHGAIADQANTVVRLVKRLVPGDLPPALDLEDEPRGPANRYPLDQGMTPAQRGYHYRRIAGNPHWHDGVAELLADIRSFMERVETALGRTPMIYTSHMWRDSDMMNDPKIMSEYPLWTVYHGERDLTTISVGAWGRDWDFIQYAEDGKNYWGMNPYHEPNIHVTGIDFTAYHGTVHGLLGLADIGRVGVAFVGDTRCVAHAQWPDGRQHLHLGPAWADQDLSGAGVPVGGDPALLAVADGLALYFRSGDHVVEATMSVRNPSVWHANQIDRPGDAKPIHDPRAVAAGDTRYACYWGDDDDWHLLTIAGGRVTSTRVLSAAGVKASPAHGQSTGQPSLYVTGGEVHLIGRVGDEGHLFDVWRDAHGSWRADDVTALAQVRAAALPAATYSPCAFETPDGVGIVFRGVGGDLWVVRRRDNAATNLTAAAHAVAAAGHPACFVMQHTPHIVYRGTDRAIHEIWPDGGAWKVQQICTVKAAADPVAATDGTTAMVAARAMDGTIQAPTFDGTRWNCDLGIGVG